MRPGDRRLVKVISGVGALVIVVPLLWLIAGAGAGPATPAPTPTPPQVPYPISISLPGGWVFPLSIGDVDQNGRWNPKGAEWLRGTELPRIVSLPWTVQLEAVMRTLNGNDEIKLSMSNYDSIAYKVQSIDQVPASEVANLAKNTPGLLVILSKADTDERWVVTAKP
jgi:hypothetical protein